LLIEFKSISVEYHVISTSVTGTVPGGDPKILQGNSRLPEIQSSKIINVEGYMLKNTGQDQSKY
jgi:hypothetical protein